MDLSYTSLFNPNLNNSSAQLPPPHPPTDNNNHKSGNNNIPMTEHKTNFFDPVGSTKIFNSKTTFKQLIHNELLRCGVNKKLFYSGNT